VSVGFGKPLPSLHDQGGSTGEVMNVRAGFLGRGFSLDSAACSAIIRRAG
jgi:hypothetical protein